MANANIMVNVALPPDAKGRVRLAAAFADQFQSMLIGVHVRPIFADDVMLATQVWKTNTGRRRIG